MAADFGSVGCVGSGRLVGALVGAAWSPAVFATWPAVSVIALAAASAALLPLSRMDALDDPVAVDAGAVDAGVADACSRRRSIA